MKINKKIKRKTKQTTALFLAVVLMASCVHMDGMAAEKFLTADITDNGGNNNGLQITEDNFTENATLESQEEIQSSLSENTMDEVQEAPKPEGTVEEIPESSQHQPENGGGRYRKFQNRKAPRKRYEKIHSLKILRKG